MTARNRLVFINNCGGSMLTRRSTKSRKLNKNAPKAKTHKPSRGKGSYVRIKDFLANLFRGLR